MDSNKVYSMLGLCMRAGKLKSGELSVLEAVRGGKAQAVIISEDASENTKKQFKDRLMINKGLGYGWKADVYGFAMFCMLVSPVWVKKIAYKVFR